MEFESPGRVAEVPGYGEEVFIGVVDGEVNEDSTGCGIYPLVCL